MNEKQEGSSASKDPFDSLFDDLIHRLERGEAVDLDAFEKEHPQAKAKVDRLRAGMRWIQGSAETQSLPAQTPPAGPPRAPNVPQLLGDFELVREIGRGGMGVVYEARQRSLEKRVALKILPLAAMLDPRALQRFRNEARAAAQLEHPHIVPVHSVGSDQGVHFYAMQFIEGINLARLIANLRTAQREQKPSKPGSGNSAGSTAGHSEETTPESAASRSFMNAITGRGQSFPAIISPFLQLAFQIADALEYAHSMGVVHRDIKPANLLIDTHGSPWLTDFGLAQVHGSPGVTLTGDMMGTLRYMSPEQAYAKRIIVDHRTDIYSLGVTLYELLTFRPAIPGGTKAEVLRRVAFEDPTPLRRIDRRIPIELDTIIMKAIAKNPDDRYQSAQELANDLRLFEQDEPIRAKPPSLAKRAGKWARKHRPLVASLAATALIVLIATSVSAVIAFDAYKKAEQAFKAEQAQKQKAQLRWRRSEGLRLVAQSALNLDQDPGLALGLAIRGAELNPGLESNNALLAAMDSIHELRTLSDHERSVGQARFSPDGRFLVTTGSESRRGSVAMPARIWDASSGKLVTSIATDGTIISAAFSPGGGRILTITQPTRDQIADANGSAVAKADLWDWATGNRKELMETSLTTADPAAFHPGGNLLVVPDRDQSAEVWDTVEGTVRTTLNGHTGQVLYAAFGPHGNRIVTFGDDNTVRLWDRDGNALHVLDWWKEQSPSAGTTAITSVSFSPDGRYLVTATSQYEVHVWSVETGERLSQQNLRGHFAQYSPDGKSLLVIRALGVDVYDAVSLKQLLQYSHRGRVLGLAMSADSKLVASYSSDPDVDLWDLKTGELRTRLRGHQATVNHVAFAPGSQQVASASQDHTARIWSVEPGKAQRQLARQASLRPEPIMSFHSDSEKVLVATQPNLTTQVWDLDTQSQLNRVSGRLDEGGSATGRFVVSDQSTVRVFESPSADVLAEFESANSSIQMAKLSPDGQRVLVIEHDGAVWLWDYPSHQRRVVELESDSLTGCFDATGKWIAVGGNSGLARVFSLESEDDVVSFSHEGRVIYQRFSPTERKLLAVTDRDRATLWNVESGQRLVEIASPDATFDRAQFSHDGKWIVTYGRTDSEQVALWDAENGNELRRLAVQGQVHVRLSPSQPLALIASRQQGTMLWNMETGESKQIADYAAATALFVADDRLVLAAESQLVSPLHRSSDTKETYIPSRIDVWNHVTNEMLHNITLPDLDVYSIDLSAKHLLVSGRSYGVHVFEADSGRELFSCHGHAAPLTFASFADEGKRIVTASWDHSVATWDAGTGESQQVWRQHQSPITAAAIGSSGKRVVTGDAMGKIILWDVVAGESLREFDEHEGAILFLDLSEDGDMLLSGSLDRTARIANLTTGQTLLFENEGEIIVDGKFGPQGLGMLMIPARDVQRNGAVNGIRIMPLEQNRVTVFGSLGSTPIELPQPALPVKATFQPGDAHVLVVTADGKVNLWNRAEPRLLQSYVPVGITREAQFSPKGEFVITVNQKSVSVWETESGQEWITLLDARQFIPSGRARMISPDSKWLFTTSGPGIVERYPLEPLTAARQRAPRPLNADEQRRFETHVEGINEN